MEQNCVRIMCNAFILQALYEFAKKCYTYSLLTIADPAPITIDRRSQSGS